MSEDLLTSAEAARLLRVSKSTINRYDTSSPQYQKIKKLSDLRRGNKVFTQGALDLLYHSEAGAGALGALAAAGSLTGSAAASVPGNGTGLAGELVAFAVLVDQPVQGGRVTGLGELRAQLLFALLGVGHRIARLCRGTVALIRPVP